MSTLRLKAEGMRCDGFTRVHFKVGEKKAESSTELEGMRQSSRAVFSSDQFFGVVCESGARQ